MIKLDPKGLLVIGVVAVLVAISVTLPQGISSGGLGWSLLVTFAVIALCVYGVVASLLLLVARQTRLERIQGVKSVLRELIALKEDFRSETKGLRDALNAEGERVTALGDAQMDTLTLLRAESEGMRERVAGISDAQLGLRTSLDEVRESYSSGGVLHREIGSLNTRVRKISATLDIIESRERKILNLVRGEIRNNELRDESLHRAMTTQADANSNVITKVEDASVAVRKMHNFLRRDGSIQIALDRFTAAERRMLAAVEAAGLDHADQVAALHARIVSECATHDAELAQIDADLASGLSDIRAQMAEEAEIIFADLDRARASIPDPRTFESNEVDSFDGESVVGPDSSTSLPRGVTEPASTGEDAWRTALQSQTGAIERFVKRQAIDVVRQVEALLQLLPRVETELRRFPPSGWWALPADTLLFLADYIERERPKRILELGSGASTVWIGTFAQRCGAELTSLEHDAEYFQKSRHLVQNFGLQEFASVHHAALRPVTVDGSSFDWYDTDVIDKLEGPFDVLVVDGPPEATGESARLPALSILEPLLADNCIVLLDDTHRATEAKILEGWIESYPEFQLLKVDLMRTGAIVRRR